MIPNRYRARRSTLADRSASAGRSRTAGNANRTRLNPASRTFIGCLPRNRFTFAHMWPAAETWARESVMDIIRMIGFHDADGRWRTRNEHIRVGTPLLHTGLQQRLVEPPSADRVRATVAARLRRNAHQLLSVDQVDAQSQSDGGLVLRRRDRARSARRARNARHRTLLRAGGPVRQLHRTRRRATRGGQAARERMRFVDRGRPHAGRSA